MVSHNHMSAHHRNGEVSASPRKPSPEPTLAALPTLKGRDLYCFCPEGSAHCHADVLIELANA